MIFGPYREPLDFGIGSRRFGHRPVVQHPVDLKAQVPIQALRITLLHNEKIITPPVGLLACRLGIAEVTPGLEIGKRFRRLPHCRPPA